MAHLKDAHEPVCDEQPWRPLIATATDVAVYGWAALTCQFRRYQTQTEKFGQGSQVMSFT